MTARDEALALLRGRFGAAWMPSIIFDDVLAGVRLGWRCDMHHIATGATFQGTYNGESELSAARACIAAWDEATAVERETIKACAECGTEWAKLADRLGEALEVSTAHINIDHEDAGTIGAALGAWRAARGKA